MESEPIVRPGPLHWLWYALGGALPERHRGWVLHDLTRRSWWARHLVRSGVQLAPVVAALLVMVPGPLVVRLAAVTAGILLGLLFSGAYVHEIAEHRVVQAGFPPGTAARARAEADAVGHAARQERYVRRWRPDTS